MKKKAGKAVTNAVKQTLAYKSLFGYPMSFYQISTFLITPKQVPAKKTREALNALIKERWARRQYGKFQISGEKYTNWVWKQKHTSRILKENTELIRFLGGIPWIKMIAITGSLAAYNAEKETDIDLLIITGKNRVWLTRGFVALILKILGKHPQHDGQPGSFCTNLFLDETKMSWDKEKRSLFVASDIVMMQPIVDKSDTYLRFMKENSWVIDYFGNFRVTFPEKDKPARSGLVLNALEKFAKRSQLSYMKNKVTTEVLRNHIIHFNKNDNAKRIMESYKNILKNLKIS